MSEEMEERILKLGKKIAGLLMMTALVMGLAAIPVMAASRKKINSINISVKAEIEPGTKFGNESVEVTVKSGKYSYDYYEVENVGFEWVESDTPTISIYLHADEGYYFSLTTASAVKINGATYVKATKQDTAETLKLTVKLPSLTEKVGDQSAVTLTDNGFVSWSDVRGAGSYELRVYRNGTAVGSNYLTTTNSYYNLRDVITRGGTYYVKVRPVNKINLSEKGEWAESAAVHISDEQAVLIRTNQAGDMPAPPVSGQWIKNDRGWWYQHSDGGFTQNNWEQIDGLWYYFDEEGYMKTGWIDWSGKRYYCVETGEMLANTTAPDGTILDQSGAAKTD